VYDQFIGRPVSRPHTEMASSIEQFCVATAPNIINRAGPGILNKVPEGIDQVPGMDVVANLLALVAEHCVGLPVTAHFAR